MSDSENPPRHQSSDPALILCDSSLTLVSYNAEAIRVLTYPRTKELHTPAALIETKLRPLLSQLRFSARSPLPPTFQSGRRQYRVRMFSLNKSRSAPDSYPAHALILERQD